MGVDGITEDKSRLEEEFLPINYDGSFTKNLSSKYDKIKDDYQIYRFFTSLLVHANFWHFLSNAIMIVIWISYFEIFLTVRKMPLLFFISGRLKRNYGKCLCGFN